MPISDAYRAAAAGLLLAGFSLVLLRLVFRDWRVAGLISSLLLVLFFSYGHAYSALKGVDVGDFLLVRHRYLVPAWIALLILGAWASARRIQDLARATQFANLVGAAALLLPGLVLASYFYRASAAEVSQASASSVSIGDFAEEETGSKPDIYYLIFDTYARADILEEQYDYDNSPFLDSLRDRGFYVADRSNSNYLWTGLSLTSSLNMDLIPNIILDGTRGNYPSALQRPIQRSAIRRQLQKLGYGTVSVPTGYRLTEILDATHFLTPDMARMENLRLRGAFNAFEGMLMHSSAVRILIDLDTLRSVPVADFIQSRLEYPARIQREYILSAFDHLETIPDIPGPKFVFVHIVSPHDPYFFGPNGEDITGGDPFTLAIQENLPPEERVALYRDQLTYVNSRIERAVDAILERSESPPIIILQSDHGPRHIELDFGDPAGDALRTRMSIFNAYYLPGDCDRLLYPTITPVNTFRIILNCYFGGSNELLEDVTYFSDVDGTRPWDFVPIDELLD